MSLHVAPVAVDRSFSDSAIRYVLPVLWMTSCFHLKATHRRRESGTCSITHQRQHRGRRLMAVQLPRFVSYVILNVLANIYAIAVGGWNIQRVHVACSLPAVREAGTRRPTCLHL